jgi:hypothetical protein
MPNFQETERLRKYVFPRLLIIPLGGFACAVTILLRALIYRELRFMPASMKTLGIDFKSDPPRSPRLEILPLPEDVWQHAMLRDNERALLNNARNVDELIAEIERPGGRLHWLSKTGLYWQQLLDRYRRQEAGQVPRLAAFFAALEAREHLRFGKTWFKQLKNALADLRIENSKLVEELLHQGVRADSLSDDSRIIALVVYGGRGGTGNGLSQVMALALHELASQLELDIEIIGVPLTGAYRMDDGTEEMKEALEYALVSDLESSTARDAFRSFPVGEDEAFSHHGPLWDTLYRIETTSYRAHMEEAAMYHAARVLRLLFFTRVGYDWRKNFGNDPMRREVKNLASIAAA